MQNTWIKVEDELPEKEIPECTIDVVISDGVSWAKGRYIFNCKLWLTNIGRIYNPTHWMRITPPEN